MFGKIYLALSLLATILVFLSFWLVPAFMIWSAFTWVNPLWGKITLWVLSLLWLLLIRPWNMFKDENFKRFVADIKKAIYFLFWS